MGQLKRFMVERDIPGVGGMSTVELCGAGRASNQALAKVDGVQWQHSYVSADKTFCVYLAESEELVRQHADLAGLPVTKITEVDRIIDPLIANN